MDLHLRLIHSQDFIKTTPEGTIDLEASKQLLLKLALENAESGPHDILIDHRKAIIHLSLTDITSLVQVMIEHRKSFKSKLAILAASESTFDLAKFMGLYAGNRGFRVGAFKDFEEAMDWMMTSTELTADAATPQTKAG